MKLDTVGFHLDRVRIDHLLVEIRPYKKIRRVSYMVSVHKKYIFVLVG